MAYKYARDHQPISERMRSSLNGINMNTDLHITIISMIMESVHDALRPEKIAFIAYNIGMYESVQKFGSLITSGKFSNGTDLSKVAELLSQSSA